MDLLQGGGPGKHGVSVQQTVLSNVQASQSVGGHTCQRVEAWAPPVPHRPGIPSTRTHGQNTARQPDNQTRKINNQTKKEDAPPPPEEDGRPAPPVTCSPAGGPSAAKTRSSFCTADSFPSMHEAYGLWLRGQI